MRKTMLVPLFLLPAIAFGQLDRSKVVVAPPPVVKAIGFANRPSTMSTSRGAGFVVGGQEADGWIELSAPATCAFNCDKVFVNGQSAGGMNVSVSSSNTAVAKVQTAVVFFGVGQTRQTFKVITTGVAAPVAVTVSASTQGSAAQTTMLTVEPPSLTGFTLDQTSVMSGATAHGMVTFNGTPASALMVKLSSNNPAVQVPASINLQPGTTATQFDVKTIGVTSTTQATVAASYLDRSPTVALTVQPAALTGFDGYNVQLNGMAPPAGAAIAMKSDDPAHASVPPTITVPGGSSTTAGVFVTDHRDASDHHVKITATLNDVSKSADHWVLGVKKPDMYVRQLDLQDRFGNAIAAPKDSQPFKACVTFGLTDVDEMRTVPPSATTLHLAYLSPTGTGTSAGHESDMPVTFGSGWRFKDSDRTHWWYQPATCIELPGIAQSGSYLDLTLLINPNHNNPEELTYGNNTYKQRITRQ